MNDRERRKQGACFRVWVSSASTPVISWTHSGIDQRFLLPRRVHALVIGAHTEEEAIERATVIGRALLGGRGVEVGKVELKCLPGSHKDEAVLARSIPDARPGRSNVRVSTPSNWDWLTKPVRQGVG